MENGRGIKGTRGINEISLIPRDEPAHPFKNKEHDESDENEGNMGNEISETFSELNSVPPVNADEKPFGYYTDGF